MRFCLHLCESRQKCEWVHSSFRSPRCWSHRLTLFLWSTDWVCVCVFLSLFPTKEHWWKHCRVNLWIETLLLDLSLSHIHPHYHMISVQEQCHIYTMHIFLDRFPLGCLPAFECVSRWTQYLHVLLRGKAKILLRAVIHGLTLLFMASNNQLKLYFLENDHVARNSMMKVAMKTENRFDVLFLKFGPCPMW